jgi:hypothetical protein
LHKCGRLDNGLLMGVPGIPWNSFVVGRIVYGWAGRKCHVSPLRRKMAGVTLRLADPRLESEGTAELRLQVTSSEGEKQMPTRTIKLKTTHAIVNEAVKRIENVLLLCRGNAYVDTEGTLHSRDEVRSQAIEYARAVQRENGRPDEGGNDQIAALLRHLYESIVTSSVTPGTGNAQHARGFVSPLMDAKSEGGKHAAKKILETLPVWVEMMQQADPAWQAMLPGLALLHRGETPCQRHGGATPMGEIAPRREAVAGGISWPSGAVAHANSQRSPGSSAPSRLIAAAQAANSG